VTKGVLSAAEANAIRDAAPETEFQLLVEALNRKGVLSAADLSAAAKPAAQPAAAAVAAQPAAAAVAPVAAREADSSSRVDPLVDRDAAASPQSQTQTKPQTPFPARVARGPAACPTRGGDGGDSGPRVSGRRAEDRRSGWD
jgi:hypothetical protein